MLTLLKCVYVYIQSLQKHLEVASRHDLTGSVYWKGYVNTSQASR
jgi:hypothetical protein